MSDMSRAVADLNTDTQFGSFPESEFLKNAKMLLSKLFFSLKCSPLELNLVSQPQAYPHPTKIGKKKFSVPPRTMQLSKKTSESSVSI